MPREERPPEVFATHANYVHLDVKQMTAERIVGWLRGFAEQCDEDGNTVSARHARSVANQFEHAINADDPVEDEEDHR